MLYLSTRGGGKPQRFSDILLEGLAADGGLYVPERFPEADLARWRRLSYPELATAILSEFMDDVPQLPEMVARTYTGRIFGTDEITPLKTLEPGLHLLALSNGPSAAFKDVALQLLGNLFEGKRLKILGATSGDTGTAAEYALRGKQGIHVFMLSPWKRMTPFQAAQMYSLQDRNVHNIAVKGVFDDCQDLVKEVNADAAFKERNRIGAVNSINWARVAGQVVYYFKGYFAATGGKSGADNEQVSFAVPTGNFGNIYAGYVAKRMGLPVKRLILAANENDVLHRFFSTGRYRVSKKAKKTTSPSMDISKASNFERYVFELVGRDPARVRDLWRALDAKGEIDLANSPYWGRVAESGFVSGRSTHADRIATIRGIYKSYGVMIDPHTADGVHVARAYREPGVPLVCLETALPVKFAETIREALGREPERPAEFAGLEERPQRVQVIEPDVDRLKRLIANES